MDGVETLDLERKVINDGVEFDVAEYARENIRMFSCDPPNKNELVTDGLFGLIRFDERVFIEIGNKDEAIIV